MIEVDHDAALPVGEQLVEQLRYQIAAGAYRAGDRLPSTRGLAEQVGISFHTVRKAYQKLAADGVLDVRRGGGYFVADAAPLSKTERLERAASTMQDALHKMVALGLSREETEMVVEEQVAYFERPDVKRRIVFAAPYRELAEIGAEQASGAVQESVEPALLADLRRRAADAVVVPLPQFQTARRAAPEAEVVGVDLHLPYEVLDRLSRLGPSETVVLATRYADATAPLTESLRLLSGFGGEVLATHIEAGRDTMDRVIRQGDLVLYTPGARRRVRPLVQRNERPDAELAPVLTAESLARVRARIGR